MCNLFKSKRLRHKIITAIFIFYCFILYDSFLFTSNTYAEPEIKSILSDGLNKVIPQVIQNYSDDLPEWAKRTDFSLHFQDDLKPLWSFETIQPIFRTKETSRHTLFIQDRFAYDTPDDTINLGLGYRYITSNEQWLLGVNTFWDYTFDRRHSRIGIGGEILGQFASIHANYYEAISGHRYYFEDEGMASEKALDGWDVEGQIQMPFMPWVHTSMKGYGWQNEVLNDVEGYSLAFIMNITKNITLELGRDDNDARENNFIKVSFTLGGPERVEYTMIENLFMKTFFTYRDLKKQSLAKVRRNHNIAVEKVRLVSVTAGGGVFIGRGT